HAETRRIASTSIEEKAIVFMDRAIEEHNLSQQLREKALRKEASLVEQAQAIRAAHKNTGVALDAIIRYQQTTEGWSAERVRRVTNLAKSTDDALTEHAAGLRNALDDGMVLPPTPAVDLSHLTETIPAERPAEAAPPRPQRWRNWEAVQKAYNALKDAGSFATEDHRYTRFAQCVDAFIGYARKNGLSANLAPQALSHAIHEWLNTKGQDFKDDNPRPSLALNNLAKVCHPDYRFKTHLGIAEKVLTAAQQTEIDKTERRYQQECQQLGLPSEGYRKHIKTVYRVMLESLEAKQSPFETLQQMQKDKGSAGMKALKDTLLDSLENNATFDSQQPTSKDELRQVMHHMINLHTFGAIDEGSPRGGAGGSQTSRHPAPTIRTKASGGGKAR
ncbi:MAG TPA: hypothetical protein VM532_10480, partial [Burkholderiales bacterium]|nr:hypothetical protein [Burkholderiales bacterium]